MSGISGIDKIRCALGVLLNEREIIARCELMLSIYDIVRTASLSDQERKYLSGKVGENIAPGIFASMMSKNPIFDDLPRLDTYTQMNGHIFHFLHTKKYSKQDFDNANRKLQQSIPHLRVILAQSLKDLIKTFLANAGYRQFGEQGKELIFTAGEHKLQVSIYTSINAVDIDECKPNDDSDKVILVPNSETLEPFMQFYQENGESAEERCLQVWVSNMEKGTIDPFIGYTSDLDIYNQFNNPRLAEMVRTNWCKKQ